MPTGNHTSLWCSAFCDNLPQYRHGVSKKRHAIGPAPNTINNKMTLRRTFMVFLCVLPDKIMYYDHKRKDHNILHKY